MWEGPYKVAERFIGFIIIIYSKPPGVRGRKFCSSIYTQKIDLGIMIKSSDM